MTGALLPIIGSEAVAPGRALPLELFGRRLVVWRAPDGRVGLADDLCPHRAVRLSDGTVSDAGRIVCQHHGWEFDTAGQCRAIPYEGHRARCDTSQIKAWPVEEHAGLVWARVDVGRAAGCSARGTPATRHRLERRRTQ